MLETNYKYEPITTCQSQFDLVSLSLEHAGSQSESLQRYHVCNQFEQARDVT